MLLMLVISVGMSGCSSLTTKEIDQPVVIKSMKDGKLFWKDDDYETVLLTPERRQILIKYGKKGKEDVICAEAPSDTGLKIDTLINATLKGEVPAKGSAEVGFNNQSNTANIALHNQLQAVRFMMAASHAVCNLYMNGAIQRDEYAKQIGNILHYTMEMSKGEMALFYATIANGQGASSTTNIETQGQKGQSQDKTAQGKGSTSPGTTPKAANGNSVYKFYLDQVGKGAQDSWSIIGVPDPTITGTPSQPQGDEATTP